MQPDLGKLQKRETILGWLYFPMFLLGTQLLIALVLKHLGYDMRSTRALILLNVWNGVVNLAAVALIFHRFLKTQFRRMHGRGARIASSVAMGFGILFGGTFAVNTFIQTLVNSFGINYVNQNQAAIEQIIRGDALLSIVLASFCAPIVEECLFRALIFRPLRSRSRVLAYAVSMLVFASLHVYESVLYQPIYVSLLSLLTYLPAGFALAWAYERAETIWAPILVHFIQNSISVVMILLLAKLEPFIEQLPKP